MGIKLINIGFGNIVSANRLVAIVSPESAPIILCFVLALLSSQVYFLYQ